jgi:hypothetical protein
MAVVQKDFKYIYWTDHEYQQYFDLKRDPYEEYDLFNDTDTAHITELRNHMLQQQQNARLGLRM